MNKSITVSIDNTFVKVSSNTTVLVAIEQCGSIICRTSITGEKRGPLCGMGVCFECKVAINGNAHRRACNTICEEGMKIVTG